MPSLASPTHWNEAIQPNEFGLVRVAFRPGYLSIGSPGWLHGAAIYCTGVILFFAAPWAVRVVVYIDRH